MGESGEISEFVFKEVSLGTVLGTRGNGNVGGEMEMRWGGEKAREICPKWGRKSKEG